MIRCNSMLLQYQIVNLLTMAIILRRMSEILLFAGPQHMPPGKG